MKKVIILNGPPNCGKDTIADHLVKKYPVVKTKSFKKHLTAITQLIYNVSSEWWEANYTRELKEKPSEKLSGLTPREALIKTSEAVIKPNYGKDYFGKIAAETLEEGINIFSDGGFPEEIECLTEDVGTDNIIIVRIKRKTCTYEGDSRNYLDMSHVPTVDIRNDGSLDDFKERMEHLLNSMIKSWS